MRRVNPPPPPFSCPLLLGLRCPSLTWPRIRVLTRYTSKMLLAAIDENHQGTYDFFYLPIDFKVSQRLALRISRPLPPHGNGYEGIRRRCSACAE